MHKTLKVKRGDKLTTITLSEDVYQLLSLKLDTLPDSPDALRMVRNWAHATIEQHGNPKQPNFSQWVTGQAVLFLADEKTQAAYQRWLGDRMLSDRQEDAIISEPQVDSMISAPDDKQAIIDRAKAMNEAGQSWASIARQFNGEGIPTPTGKGEWRSGNLARLCK